MPVRYDSSLKLRPFQRRFIRKVLHPATKIAALSIARGNGKTSLAADLLSATLRPGSGLFEAGTENFLVSSSLGQSRRTTFGALRRQIEGLRNFGADYRVADNPNNARIRHPASRTEISVLPASGKGAQGLGLHSHWIVCDEPGSWAVNDGQVMFEAISESLGKPNSRMKVLLIGTRAPGPADGWWAQLLDAGSTGSTYVLDIRATDDEIEHRWDHWNTIQRTNPLMCAFPESRKHLLELRDRARHDSRLKATFCSYRLNVPTADRSEVLLQVSDFKTACARPLPERFGAPLVGLDIGANRAWSSGVGIWPSGRIEAVALAPGLPSLRDQERRDGVPFGTYERLHEQGQLFVSHGRHVPRVRELVELVRPWGPALLLADYFKVPELRDSSPPCPVVARRPLWSHATEDIGALRRHVLDGPFSIAPGSQSILAASLAATTVENDQHGGVRMTKSSANKSRDDVSAAWILAAGAWSREYGVEREPAKFVFAPAGGPVTIL